MSKPSNIQEPADGGSDQRLVQALALLIAEQYALGWKAHAEHVGEMAGMPAKTWAECNWQSFTEEASAFCSLNDKLSHGANNPNV